VEITITKKDQIVWSNQDGAAQLDFTSGVTALVNGDGPVKFVPVDSSRCVRKDGTQVRGLRPEKLSRKGGSTKEEVAASNQSRKAGTNLAYGTTVTLLVE